MREIIEINLHQNGALWAQESKHLSSLCFSRKTLEGVDLVEITGKKDTFVFFSFFILKQRSRRGESRVTIIMFFLSTHQMPSYATIAFKRLQPLHIHETFLSPVFLTKYLSLILAFKYYTN